MRQTALERLWEARGHATETRDLADLVRSLLARRDVIRHPDWLESAEAVARRLTREARALEDRIYEARYYLHLDQPPEPPLSSGRVSGADAGAHAAPEGPLRAV